MSIKSIPMVGNTLPNNPRPKLIPRSNKVTSFHKQTLKTKEQDRDELIASMAPKIGRKVTQKEAAANARKLRDFHERWRAKRAEQTLQEALFDVYVKQKGDERKNDNS